MIFVLGLVAIVAAWLLPGHYLPWTTFQQESVAAAGGLALALAAVVSPTVRGMRLTAPSIVALAFAVVPLLQWGVGWQPFVADAVLPSLYAVAFSGTACVAHALMGPQRQVVVGGLHGAIIVGALVSSAVGLHQWLQGERTGFVEYLEAGDRVYANFSQPNQFALLLAFGLASAVWLFERRYIGRVVAGLLVALLGFELVMTQSRAGWMSVALISCWLLFARRRVALRTTPVAVVVACAAFAIATMMWAPLNAWMGGSTATVLVERASQVGTRSLHWRTLWDAVQLSPMIGWGFMQVPRAQLAAVLNHPPTHEWVTYSHNGFLDLAVWMGLPLAAVLVLAIVYWLWRRSVHCLSADAWSMLALVAVFLAQSLVEFPYAYMYFVIPIGLAVGVIEFDAAGDVSAAARAGVRFPKWALLLVGGGMALMLATVVQEYLQLEEQGRRARFKEAGYDFDGIPPAIPDLLLLDNQRDLLWFRVAQAKPDMHPVDLERMARVTHRYLPPAALLRYALAAGLNGRPDDARRFIAYICSTGTRRNCDDGRSAWAMAQEKYPQLKDIAFEPPKP